MLKLCHAIGCKERSLHCWPFCDPHQESLPDDLSIRVLAVYCSYPKPVDQRVYHKVIGEAVTFLAKRDGVSDETNAHRILAERMKDE